MPDTAFHEHFMRLALEEARAADDQGEVPTGCVIVRFRDLRRSGIAANPVAHAASDDDALEHPVIARAHNMTEATRNPAAHAEMLAIAEAARAIGDFRLADTILYVTKEPCPMCAGAIVLARIPLVVWGMSDPRRGGQSAFGILGSDALIHRADVIPGILESETSSVIRDFFARRRIEARANAAAGIAGQDFGPHFEGGI